MASWFVSDVVGRLLRKLNQWNEEEHIHMGLYFDGIDKLNQLENTLMMVCYDVFDAEAQHAVGVYRILTYWGWHVNHPDNKERHAAALVPEWVTRLKHILYELEELFEEVEISERRRKQISGFDCKRMIRSLCVFSSYNLNVQNRLAHQFGALTTDLSKITVPRPGRDAVMLRENQSPQFLHCAAYLSLFPMEHNIRKTELCNLWMAQGFLEQPSACQRTPKLVGHQYYSDLGRFHINRENASWMGQVECLLVDHEDVTVPNGISTHLYHVSFIVGSSWKAPAWLLAAKQLRSLFLFPRDSDSSVTILNLEELLSGLTYLRALDLGRADLHNLPDSIARLTHLRYLKLGGPLQSLPKSITSLHYLQTLDFQACPRLIDIPNNFNNNVDFVFSADDRQITVDESNSLDAVIGSSKIAGKVKILFKRRRSKAASEARSADLKNKLVYELEFEWLSTYQVPFLSADSGKEESVLEKLKPPQSLKSLVVRFWKGIRFPSWETSPYVNFPHLTSIEIEGCNSCTYLPSFSRLPSLMSLRLANLKALEYIEKIGTAGGYINNHEASWLSLKILKLEELPKLKEWSSDIQQRTFPALSELQIYLCPRLMSMPQAATLTWLAVQDIHVNLLKHLQKSPTSSSLPKLSNLQIASISQLYSLSVNSDDLITVRIKRCEDLVRVKIPPADLVFVEAYNCGKLRHISGEINYLKIWRCEELELWNYMMEKDDGGDHAADIISTSTSVGSAAWQWQGLTELQVGSITKLESLSRGLASFTNLKTLKILQLCKLESLPKCIGHLTYIRWVEIVECSNMRTLFVSSDSELDSCRINLPYTTLRIERCEELVDNLFGGTPISLKGLEFHRCDRLKDISGKKLEFDYLAVDNCPGMHLWEDLVSSWTTERVGSAAWQGLKSVRRLKLTRISKIESLPRGLTHLMALYAIKISQLHNLRELPEWIGHLSNLKYLVIEECPKVTQLPDSLGELTCLKYLRIIQCNPELKSRCQETTGEDWPKIKHIKDVYVNQLGEHVQPDDKIEKEFWP